MNLLSGRYGPGSHTATGTTGHNRPTAMGMPLAAMGMPLDGMSRTPPGATTNGTVKARLTGDAVSGVTTTTGKTTVAVARNRLGKGGATPHRPLTIPPVGGGSTRAGGRRRPRRPPPAPGKTPSPLAHGSHVRGINGPNGTMAARTTRTKPTSRRMEERMPPPHADLPD